MSNRKRKRLAKQKELSEKVDTDAVPAKKQKSEEPVHPVEVETTPAENSPKNAVVENTEVGDVEAPEIEVDENNPVLSVEEKPVDEPGQSAKKAQI